jgi:hypothetical protein
MPILIALLAVGALGFAAYKGYQAVSSDSSGGDSNGDSAAADTNAPGASTIDTTVAAPEGPLLNSTGGSAEMITPSDRNSWPAGDKVWQLAQAIAKAEGYGVSDGNGPTRNHNPGDISDGANTYGHDPLITDSKVTTFPDDATGWQWLYHKLKNILDGGSHVYSPSMTFLEFAQKYAGSYVDWARNVTNDLGVSQSTRLADWYSAT